MSRSPRATILTAALPLVPALLLLAAGAACADEGEAAGWRQTYDLVMMWVNFAILAFFIVKYGRAPLRRFLEDESRRTAEAIHKAEESKARMERELAQAEAAAAAGRERLTAVRARIIADGERRRTEAIEAARRESELLLTRARQAAAHEFAAAAARLRSELVEEAVQAALGRLPAEMRPEDHARLLERFIASA